MKSFFSPDVFLIHMSLAVLRDLKHAHAFVPLWLHHAYSALFVLHLDWFGVSHSESSLHPVFHSVDGDTRTYSDPALSGRS